MAERAKTTLLSFSRVPDAWSKSVRQLIKERIAPCSGSEMTHSLPGVIQKGLIGYTAFLLFILLLFTTKKKKERKRRESHASVQLF